MAVILHPMVKFAMSVHEVDVCLNAVSHAKNASGRRTRTVRRT